MAFTGRTSKNCRRYYAALDQGELPLAKGYILTEEDKIRRQTIMRLMCDLSLDYAAMSATARSSISNSISRPNSTLWPTWKRTGWSSETDAGLEVTECRTAVHPQHRHALRSVQCRRTRRPLFQNDMNTVAIIGGGITGLTAAFQLQRTGHCPSRFMRPAAESAASFNPSASDGYLAEFGPNTILETSPKIARLDQ